MRGVSSPLEIRVPSTLPLSALVINVSHGADEIWSAPQGLIQPSLGEPCMPYSDSNPLLLMLADRRGLQIFLRGGHVEDANCTVAGRWATSCGVYLSLQRLDIIDRVHSIRLFVCQLVHLKAS